MKSVQKGGGGVAVAEHEEEASTTFLARLRKWHGAAQKCAYSHLIA